MPSRFDWHSQIKSIENELRASKIALEFLLPRLDSEPIELREGLRPRIFQFTRINLERTYFVRIFSEFEGCLRSYFSSYKSTEPVMRQLIDSIASNRKIPPSRTAAIHAVRESRNQIIHTPFASESTAANFVSAHSDIQRFVALLPDNW